MTPTWRARLWQVVFATVALAALPSRSTFAQAPTVPPSDTASSTTPEPVRNPSLAAPRALVLVDAPGTDAFFPAFGHEVVATALLERGFSVVPPQVAASVLRADGRDPQACLTSAPCRREVASSVGAVTLVVLRLRPDAEDTRRANSALELSHAPFESLEAMGDAAGDALALGDTWRAQVARIDRAQAPCRVVVRSELAVEAMLDGRALPSSVPPGTHAVELRASGRTPWRGRLVCADGEGIEVKVR